MRGILGTTYGGDGVKTFWVPDYQGYFLRGVDKSDGNRDPGRKLGTAQGDQPGAHSHDYNQLRGGGGNQMGVWTNEKLHQAGPGIPFTTFNNPTGETRPKNVAVNYVIRIGQPAK